MDFPASCESIQKIEEFLNILVKAHKAEVWHDGSKPFLMFGQQKSRVYSKVYSVRIGSGPIIQLPIVKVKLHYNWPTNRGELVISSQGWELFLERCPQLFGQIAELERSESAEIKKELKALEKIADSV